MQQKMATLLSDLNLDSCDLVLSEGIRFWFKLMDHLNISSINHCKQVIKELEDHINNINGEDFVDQNEKNLQESGSDKVMITVIAMGVKFWQNATKRQHIDVKNCEAIINNVQAFVIDHLVDIKDLDTDKSEPLDLEIKTEEGLVTTTDYDNCMVGNDNVATCDENEDDNSGGGVVVPNIWKRMYHSLKPEDSNEEEHRRIIRKIERAKAMTKIKIKRKKKAGAGMYHKSFAESCLECNKVFKERLQFKIR